MTGSPTGRIVAPYRPPFHELPRPGWATPIQVHLFNQRQALACMRFELEQLELDDREEECWRMFGITIDYFMDEKVITLP